MSAPMFQVGNSSNLTATGDVGSVGVGKALLGVFVNSTTSGTLVLRKGGSGGTVLNGVITFAAIGWYPFPVLAPGGLHATIGGTLDVTFIYADSN